MEYVPLIDLLNHNIKHQYINLLSFLTQATDIPDQLFYDKIHNINKMGIIIVCILRTGDDIIIIGTGTLIKEPKIIHGGKSVGHIEDIVVHPLYRNKHIAQTILNKLIEYGSDCYKIILDCNPSLEPFYEKAGFNKKCIQMTKPL
jgi:glucosamine-phosphate N-acetyltransferase